MRRQLRLLVLSPNDINRFTIQDPALPCSWCWALGTGFFSSWVHTICWMRDFVRLSLEDSLEVITLKSCHNLNLEFMLWKKNKTVPRTKYRKWEEIEMICIVWVVKAKLEECFRDNLSRSMNYFCAWKLFPTVINAKFLASSWVKVLRPLHKMK